MRRDSFAIRSAWKFGVSDKTGEADLQVWETHPPCNPGDVSVTIDTPGDTGYLRLTPDQQKDLGQWLLGENSTPMKTCYCGWCTDSRARDLDAKRMRERMTALEAERDGWRADAALRAANEEDLQHQVGELKEKLRRIKGYVNSLGGD